MVLNRLHDFIRIAQHARRSRANLQVVLSNRLAVVHGVKGSDLYITTTTTTHQHRSVSNQFLPLSRRVFRRPNTPYTRIGGISRILATSFITEIEQNPCCLCPKSNSGITAAFLYCGGYRFEISSMRRRFCSVNLNGMEGLFWGVSRCWPGTHQRLFFPLQSKHENRKSHSLHDNKYPSLIDVPPQEHLTV